MNFKDRLLPVRVGSGFRMEGYFIWCGSMIRGDDGAILCSAFSEE